MKHPLTSKERRGLLAVAAAALLCISSAFIFRNCSSHGHRTSNNPTEIKESTDSITISEDSTDFKAAKESKGKKANKGSKSKKRPIKKAPKVYPIRDPLSEPCD